MTNSKNKKNTKVNAKSNTTENTTENTEKNEIFEETENMSYEDKMLYAFVGKPEKFLWYKKAFLKYNVNGVKTFAWNWSWYAFFFGFWFLLYRKVYLIALAFILGNVLLGSITGIGTLLLWIGMGGTLTYFVYSRYINKKLEIESKIKDENKRIETMKKIGGVNTIIVWIPIIIIATILVFSFGVGFMAGVVSPNL